MNNIPDEDTKLTSFLRQYRSIAPAEQPELEDRLMLEIDALPSEKHCGDSHYWWRYVAGVIGLVITGIVGGTIFHVMNPPEPSVAELEQLNLYLEANIPELVGDLDSGLGKHEDLDLDEDLL